MTNQFTSTFGNSAVQPSYVAYANYSFSTALTLFWPQFPGGQSNPTIAARFMKMTATANTGLNVSLPDAILVSTGYDLLVFNAGSNTFNVVDFNGGAVATIAAGQTFYIINEDNTSQSGVWGTVQFGVGTGSASAAALAGAGLLAAAGLLEVNLPPTIVTTSYTLATTARGTLQVWAGGSGAIALPAAATAGDGFIFALNNTGTGSVTVVPNGSDQIDGASTSVFAQTQSGYIVSSGTAWYTIGKGIANTFTVTLLNLNVAGSSNITETSAQAQNIIQQFTGLLTGNIAVIVPNTVQLYVLYNNTTGPYTLTFITAGGTGVQVAQGSNTIVYCDGTNIKNAFTAVIGNSLTLPVGSATGPTLNFIGSTTTGLYSSSANHVSITSQGTEVADFSAPVSAVNYLTFTASATTNAVLIGAAGTDTDIGITLVPQGGGTVTIPAAILTGLPTATTAASSDNSTRIATTAFVKAQTNASNFTGSSVTGTNAIVVGATNPSNWSLTNGNIITFTPANINTSNATLNVDGTGVLPLYKISFAGIVNLLPGDLNTLVPMICQYNATDGYYLILNIVAYGTVQEVSTTQSITAANTYDTYIATTGVTLNIAQSVMLPEYFYINVFAQGGAITIGINAGDKINNGTTGAGLTMPQGTSGTLYTDSNGNLWLTGTQPLLGAANTWIGTQSYNSGNLILKGSTSGTTILNASAIAGTTTLTLPAATDTLTGKATTDALTNKTFNTAATGNIFQINSTGITAISGNTGTVATTTGSLTSGHLAAFDGSGNIKDGGAPSVAAGSALTSSQTWTSPSDITSATVFKFTLVGAGGGGAGTGASNTGGGGGSGGACILYKSGLAASTGYVLTLASGAAGGVAGNNSGSNASSSTFVVAGTTMTANGGNGGITAGNGGGGGTASGGSININGGNGGGGTSGNFGMAGGMGAATILGGNGGGTWLATGYSGGTNTGAGGGGAGSNSGSFAGGAGATGILIIERISG